MAKFAYLAYRTEIIVSDELLHDLLNDPNLGTVMNISLTPGREHRFYGAIVRVREGIYRITGYDRARNTWTGSWPD